MKALKEQRQLSPILMFLTGGGVLFFLFLAFCYFIGYLWGSRRYEFIRNGRDVDFTITRYLFSIIPIYKKRYKGLDYIKTKRERRSEATGVNGYRKLEAYAHLKSGERIKIEQLVDMKDDNKTTLLIDQINNFVEMSSKSSLVIHNNRLASFIVSVFIFIVGSLALQAVLTAVTLFGLAVIPENMSFSYSSGGNNDSAYIEETQNINDVLRSGNVNSTSDDNDNVNTQGSEPDINDETSMQEWGSEIDTEIVEGGETETETQLQSQIDSNASNSSDQGHLAVLEITVDELPKYVPKIANVNYDHVYHRQPEHSWQYWVSTTHYKDKELAEAYKNAFDQAGWETSKITEYEVYENDGVTDNVSYNFEFRTNDQVYYGDVVTIEESRGVSAIVTVPVVN